MFQDQATVVVAVTVTTAAFITVGLTLHRCSDELAEGLTFVPLTLVGVWLANEGAVG
jgi:hypothetical protein